MINVKDWSAWFVASGNNGWIHDSVTVKWKETKDKELVSVSRKRNNGSNVTINGWAKKTSLGKALKSCDGGFGWVTCGRGTNKSGSSISQPQISFSAL